MTPLKVCVGLLCYLGAAAASGILTAKGFYCRDPDTGKLYPVNATWPSATFCGSYTCRVRRKSINEVKQPLREINITKDSLLKNDENKTEEEIMNENFNLKLDNDIMQSRNTPKVASADKETLRRMALEKIKSIEFKDISNDGDRYLTSNEIKALTELLHSVKKSDLEAIVEIYNIAQDIYKEIDSASNDNLIDETVHDVKHGKILKIHNESKESAKKHTSYWYEPLDTTNIKSKIEMQRTQASPVSDLPMPKDTFPDMAFEVARTVPLAVPSKKYLNPLEVQEYNKKIFYYPITNFHRSASYIHNPEPQSKEQAHTQKPCKHVANNMNDPNHLLQWYNNRVVKTPLSLDNQRNDPPLFNQNEVQRQTFSDHNNNGSSLPNPYFTGNPWTLFDLYSRNHHHRHHPSYLGAAYVAHIPHAILVNPDLTNIVAKEEQPSVTDKNMKTRDTLSEEKLLPEWKTDSLSDGVLDEVRANVVSRTKLFPFSLRKKVKLDRIGKVIKLDEFARRKRETKVESPDSYEDFEVYIERSTCEQDIEPGFFRIGNATQPFPACCPQRIGNR